MDGDRIVAVGPVSEGGRREIDAEGHVVSPGFVDGHTHMDAQVFWDPFGTSSSWHGVTTVVMGNCGFTLAPVRPEAPELVVRNLERAEDISAEAMASGITWGWEHFAEYLDAVDALPKAINYSAYLGHSALRTWAMGERAFEETASEDDFAMMERELRSGLAAGAMGFTTSRSEGHETADDRPVASRIATWDEVARLVDVMTTMRRGIFELAMGPPTLDEGSDELHRSLEALALGSGRPVTFGVVPSRAHDRLLDLIDRTVAQGGRMVGQTHCRGLTVVTSFRTRLPFDKLPRWRDLRALPLEDQRRALLDPVIRQDLIAATEAGEYGRAIGAEARKPDYDSYRLYNSPSGQNPSLSEVAKARGVHPVEVLIQSALDTDFGQLFTQPAMPDIPNDRETLLRILRHPHTVMTFSDAGAHVSQIADNSLQSYLLAHWVRELEEIPIEEAIQMITSTPASFWDFRDRGVLQPGFVADVNIFDPKTVGSQLPTVETDLPGGAKRLQERSTGFLATIVAGQVVLERGEHTGLMPGRLLRSQPEAGHS